MGSKECKGYYTGCDCGCGRPVPQTRPGMKYVPIPTGAGRIVSMIEYRDSIYVAFELAVYKRVGEDWEQILAVGPL